MKVLLINPYSYPSKSAGDFNEFLTPMPPIGMAYLLAALEAAKIEVSLFDDLLEHGDNNKLTDILLKIKPDLIGIPIYTSSVVYRFEEISVLIRRILPLSKIMSGNLHAKIFAKELLLSKKLDIIVKGEGEITLPFLTEALSNDMDLQSVSGIIFRRADGVIIETPDRNYVEDLNKLSFPAWHLMPYQRYNINELGKIAETGIFILGSRGCPFSCDFCSLLMQGKRRRCRTPQNICDEIEWLIEKFNYKSFHFIDAIWPIDKKELFDFCDEMKRRGLNKKIIWGTETRIDTLDKEMLIVMRAAGCRKVMFGIESGDQAVLDSVNKKNVLARATQVVQWSHELGLSPTGFFIIGLPGETEQKIRKTIAYAKSLQLHFAKFSCFVPYPGTAIFENLRSRKLLKNENSWSNYTSYPTKENPPVYLPEGITIERLIYLQKLAHLSFYLRPKQIWYTICVLKYSIRSFRDAIGLLFKLLK